MCGSFVYTKGTEPLEFYKNVRGVGKIKKTPGKAKANLVIAVCIFWVRDSRSGVLEHIGTPIEDRSFRHLRKMKIGRGHNLTCKLPFNGFWCSQLAGWFFILEVILLGKFDIQRVARILYVHWSSVGNKNLLSDFKPRLMSSTCYPGLKMAWKTVFSKSVRLLLNLRLKNGLVQIAFNSITFEPPANNGPNL